MFRSIFLKTKFFIKELLNPAEKNNKQAQRVKPWFLINGDKTLRLQYPLNKTSIVFDLGGYKGDWAYQIWKEYQSQIYVFEPYKPYCDTIRARFAAIPSIKIFEYGLGSKNEELGFSVAENASSVFNSGEKTATITIHSIQEFLEKHKINKVDLIKINIEGGEYELLEYLLENNLIDRFENLQVQFHDFVPGAESRMKSIQERLGRTHYTTYKYEFVWENWKRK